MLTLDHTKHDIWVQPWVSMNLSYEDRWPGITATQLLLLGTKVVMHNQVTSETLAGPGSWKAYSGNTTWMCLARSHAKKKVNTVHYLLH